MSAFFVIFGKKNGELQRQRMILLLNTTSIFLFITIHPIKPSILKHSLLLLSVKTYLIRQRQNMYILCRVYMKHMKFIFGTQIISNASKRGTACFWYSVVDDYNIVIISTSKFYLKTQYKYFWYSVVDYYIIIISTRKHNINIFGTRLQIITTTTSFLPVSST